MYVKPAHITNGQATSPFMFESGVMQRQRQHFLGWIDVSYTAELRSPVSDTKGMHLPGSVSDTYPAGKQMSLRFIVKLMLQL